MLRLAGPTWRLGPRVSSMLRRHGSSVAHGRFSATTLRRDRPARSPFPHVVRLAGGRPTRQGPVCAPPHRRGLARHGTHSRLRLVPTPLARAALGLGERGSSGPRRRRLPRRLDHAGLGRTAWAPPFRASRSQIAASAATPRAAFCFGSKEDVLVLRPAAVVLLIGTNDLEQGATPEIAAGNLKLILAAISSTTRACPSSCARCSRARRAMKRPADQIKAINALYLAPIKNDPQVTYLETWPLFADPNGDAIAAEFPDLLHLNEIGYANGRRPCDRSSRPRAHPRPSRIRYARRRVREPLQWPRSDRLGLSAHVRSRQGERGPLAGRGSQRRRLADRHRESGLRRPDVDAGRTLRRQKAAWW